MKLRSFLFWTHLIAGVTAGTFIFSSAVTGMMLAFEPYIVAWSEKEVRYVQPPANAVRLDLDVLAAKAQENKPKGKVSGMTVKSDHRASVLVSFGREGSLYINPYTGDVLGGVSKTHEFLHFIEEWHRWLVKRDIGKPIIGASTMALLVLTLSGIYIWWPKSWGVDKLKSITLFNFSLSGKARDWNWHNVFGFWSCCFLLIITTSGLVMSYQWANNLLFRLTGNEPPIVRSVGGGTMAQNSKPGDAKSADGNLQTEVTLPMASFDLFWAQIMQKTTGSEWISINIRLPQKADGVVTVRIQEKEPGPGIGRHAQITMKAATGEFIKGEPFSSLNAGQKARIWARYLHTGEAGGLLGKIIAFLAALGAAFLVWTGIALTWRRYRNWRAKAKRGG